MICAVLLGHCQNHETSGNILLLTYLDTILKALVYPSNNFSEEFRTLWTKELLSLSYNKAEVISVKSNLYIYWHTCLPFFCFCCLEYWVDPHYDARFNYSFRSYLSLSFSTCYFWQLFYFKFSLLFYRHACRTPISRISTKTSWRNKQQKNFTPKKTLSFKRFFKN